MNELVAIQSALKAPKSQYNKGVHINEQLASYIHKYFSYNHITGCITRTDRANSNGSYDKYGYLILKIKGRQFKAHRIAWMLYYGSLPRMEIDHINRIRDDNRICNLREVDRCSNIHNTNIDKNKDTGVIGVYVDKCTPGLKSVFTTRIGRKMYRFKTKEEAINLRIKHGKRI